MKPQTPDNEGNLAPIADIAAFVKHRDNGECFRVTHDLYLYYLEVLPPVFMGAIIQMPDGRSQYVVFGFAEGAEYVTAFWVTREPNGTLSYWAEKTNILNPNRW